MYTNNIIQITQAFILKNTEDVILKGVFAKNEWV